MKNQDGLLVVVSGPSGVGKGTICKAAINRNPQIKLSVSATTRNKREGEKEGVSYFFKTREEFERMIEKGELLEYAKIFNSNYYGTPRAYVEAEVAKGNDIILEIDYHGAFNVKTAYPQAVLVFIAPPEMSKLKARLEHRGTENAEARAERLRTAREEMEKMTEYDYVIVNDSIEKAVEAFEAILCAEKCRSERNRGLIEALREETI